METLRGGLIVSCQPVVGGPMDTIDIITCQARAAEAGGARGLRVAGVNTVQHVVAASGLPVIGITKCDLSDSPVRITPTIDDVRGLVDAGAQIIAYDATDRVRPQATEALVRAIHDAGAIAMADCASLKEGRRAQTEGADILGTTMSGYADELAPEDAPPDLQLISDFAELNSFVIAEGRVRTPKHAAQAIRAGANAIVVGSAITRIEYITEWYTIAIDAQLANSSSMAFGDRTI